MVFIPLPPSAPVGTPVGAVDRLFPFPDPSFLFVYDITIRYLSQSHYDTESEGWVVDPGDLNVLTVRGYISSPDARLLSGAAGEHIDAVVLLPLSATISYQDEIQVDAQENLPPVMFGRYRIVAVRPNPSHCRILVARTTSPISQAVP